MRGRGDRARTTFWNFVLMAASAAVGLIASVQGSLPLFFDGFIVLFAFSGVGNGSTEKIPAILRAKLPDDGRESRRPANALIGIAGAIGAFGGVLVDVAFRQSFLSYRNGNGANTGFIGSTRCASRSRGSSICGDRRIGSPTSRAPEAGRPDHVVAPFSW